MLGRKQKRVANGCISEVLDTKCGVPQGSVLGPLFFLIYINDLQGALGNCHFKLYANDTVLYWSDITAADAGQHLQQSLNKFSAWCQVNKLTVNTKKKQYMVFASRSRVKKANNVQIFMNGKQIQKVPSFKYLGIMLDLTLTYNVHISSTIRLILHKMALLAKLKKYLTKDTALTIYKTMLLPYFDYADVVFHKAKQTDLDKLQRLQNRCLRICLGHNRLYGTKRAHKEASAAFLKDRRRAHILNFMYLRQARTDLLNVREIRTRAHDAPLFTVKVPRCEAFKRSVGYFGALEWNELPPDTRNVNPFLVFKYQRKLEMLHPLTIIEP